MTHAELFEAYKGGERRFQDLDFEESENFSQMDLPGIIFENCFLHSSDFSGSNLSNALFLKCNIKCIDLRKANFTNTVIKNCSVECSMFKGAVTTNFKFEENWCYGSVVWQKDFDEYFINEGEAISDPPI